MTLYGWYLCSYCRVTNHILPCSPLVPVSISPFISKIECKDDQSMNGLGVAYTICGGICSHQDIAETLLKLSLNTNQSIYNQRSKRKHVTHMHHNY